MQNKVSAELIAQTITDINAAYQTLRTKLPFLINLTKEERQSLPRMGSGSMDFVEKTLAFVSQHPEAFPANFSTAEFLKDGTLNTPWKLIIAQHRQFNEEMEDTELALNSDLFMAALEAYAYIKANNRNGAYDAYLDSVKGRFAKRPRNPGTPPNP